MTLSAISPTSLDDPYYYLHNAQQVIRWCLRHDRHLLHHDEAEQLTRILSLEKPCQALLIRMVLRKGNLFRKDQLSYKEIPQVDEAIKTLVDTGCIEDDPLIPLKVICDISRKNELIELIKHLLSNELIKSSCRKVDLITTLQSTVKLEKHVRLTDIWSEAPFKLIELSCHTLFDRVRLMFFGNLYQHWNEFVLTELGLQTFEPVSFHHKSRPFQSREEVDQYLQLHQIEDQLASQDDIESLLQQLPKEINCEWIQYRYQKLLFKLGHQAERNQQSDLAIRIYQQTQYEKAQLRLLRLMEKHYLPAEVNALANKIYQNISNPEIRIGVERLVKRTAKKIGIHWKDTTSYPIPTTYEVLAKPDHGRVEYAVIERFTSQNRQLYYVENRLFTALFALLFWKVLFAPVRGAFFNPFQSGPADLYRPDFSTKRNHLIEEHFSQLETGQYRKTILQHFEQKFGTSCSLIHWPSISKQLITLALEFIPAEHLVCVFRHLLLDLRNHRKGLPDLIEFNHQDQSYQLIEVKGPGDRLQDHQGLWIQALLKANIPVSLLHISWQDECSRSKFIT